MRAFKAQFPRKLLYQKYKPLMWPEKELTYGSFLQAIMHHKGHKPPETVVIAQSGQVKKDTAGIAKMMTELYARKLEGLGPEDITTKDYVSVNKLVIDEQKLSLDKNAQMLEFAKIFGLPEIEPTRIETTEEVKDAELGPAEDAGDKPQDS